jgi:hypothetical protein
LQNTTQIELNTINDQGHGTKINLLPQQIALQCLGDTAQTGENPILQGLITLGGGATDEGISIESDNDIILNNRSGGHGISVKSDSVEISDVNGIKITFDPTKITLTDVTNTYVAHILWE